MSKTSSSFRNILVKMNDKVKQSKKIKFRKELNES